MLNNYEEWINSYMKEWKKCVINKIYSMLIIYSSVQDIGYVYAVLKSKEDDVIVAK